MTSFRNGDSVWYRNRRYIVFGCRPLYGDPERLILRHPHRLVFITATPEEVALEPPAGVLQSLLRWLSTPPRESDSGRQTRRLF